MRIILLVLIGWFVGMGARILLPGKSPGGFVTTTLIGIAGACLSMAVGYRMGWWHPGDAPGFFLSLGGAIALFAIYRAYKRKTD
jgi:uncharacterized membrane protein YeaQ/YmgE (transglycosylase-associated protein family)